jgi:hypothetical protein
MDRLWGFPAHRRKQYSGRQGKKQENRDCCFEVSSLSLLRLFKERKATIHSKHIRMKRLLPWVLLSALFLSFGFSNLSRAQEADYGYRTDSLINACLEDVSADSVESYLQFLQDMGTRFLIAPNRREVVESIKQKFLQLGADQVRIDSFLCYTKINYSNLKFDTTTWQYNVAATISGITDGNQVMVMGAHYDDVVAPEGDPMIYAPGADDNASGVAALFEAVRVLSMHEFQPVYDVEFVAFSAEELMYFGHSGAQAYVDTTMAHGMNIELMINNDMIAYTATDNWQLTISNYVGSQWLTYIAEEITEDYTTINPVVRNLSNQAGADCKYFYEAGVPCLYFMEKDFNPNYHTIDDLVENLSVDYTTESIKVSIGSIIKITDYLITDIKLVSAGELKLYPNPTRDVLNVSLDNQFNVEATPYSIIDLQGRQLVTGEISNSGNVLMLDHLPDGMYILNLEIAASRPVRRMFVKH